MSSYSYLFPSGPTRGNVPFRKHPKLSSSSSVSCTLGHDNFIPRTSQCISPLAISASPNPKEFPMPMPKHVAVIMDGNRRWADENGLSARDGHKAGLRKLGELAPFCYGLGVRVVTAFAFSSQNWNRATEEVNNIMTLFEEFVAEFGADPIIQDNVRFSVIGDIWKLPESLKRQIKTTERATQANDGAQFVMALNYGGREEIIEATKQIATKVKVGELSVEDIDKEFFEKELQTRCIQFPSPDLVIRTSGEKRLSNFLLWQMAYTELQFVDKFFPDLEEADIMEAMASFQGRKRRFGGN